MEKHPLDFPTTFFLERKISTCATKAVNVI